MAKRVTEEDIKIINEVYLACGTYSKTAEITRHSASTVKKYILPDYKPAAMSVSTDTKIEPATIDEAMNYLLSNSNLCSLTPREREDLKNIWKGMIV